VGRWWELNLPFVLFARLGRRKQFVVPLNVRIKLICGLAVTTACSKQGTISAPRKWLVASYDKGDLLFIIRGVGKTWGTNLLTRLRRAQMSKLQGAVYE
jgi:hypothetical protein